MVSGIAGANTGDHFAWVWNLISFQDVLYYAITLFGAIAMYVFALNRGFGGAVPLPKENVSRQIAGLL